VSLIERNPMFLQKRPEFFLERQFAMVLFLIFNVRGNRLDI
jgi:hypothetical protein